ncbi:MAG: 1-acyl-sn-glycerol-3-phosphate acyltransferase [Anaerolineae bacterium]|nr:1-acyl-sn-glycerol-3-phosphate acyltransferase [Anaerolineae bacterium]
MTSSDSSSAERIHPIVQNQERYTLRRRLLHGVVLRLVGFGMLIKPHIEGRELVPANGPTIFIMNHIGAIDPFVAVGAVRSRYMVPMSKIENYSHPILSFMAHAWGVFPVRRGEVDRLALTSTLWLLEQGHAVLMAPEGTRSPSLIEAKEGMTYIATKANAIIAPIGLDGTDRFPGDLKRLRRAPVSIRFGRPFRLKIGDRRRIPRDEMAQMTREIMWQLATLLPEQRRGVYSDLDQMTTDTLDFLDG